MSILRLFQKRSLREGETLTLTLDAAHYLSNVRRMHAGDRMIIFNGEGGEFQAQILSLKKDRLMVEIGCYQAVNNESPLRIALAQGIARGEKMDLIIQKAVELGVDRIIPLFTERSNVKLEVEKRNKRQQHWQMVAISACEQCGRAFIPEVMVPLGLSEWLKTFTGTGFTLSPTSRHTISSLSIPDSLALTLLVGPEGGLSESEIALTEQKGFLSLSLGPRILRTETAPLAAIAALQSRFGDLG